MIGNLIDDNKNMIHGDFCEKSDITSTTRGELDIKFSSWSLTSKGINILCNPNDSTGEWSIVLGSNNLSCEVLLIVINSYGLIKRLDEYKPTVANTEFTKLVLDENEYAVLIAM